MYHFDCTTTGQINRQCGQATCWTSRVSGFDSWQSRVRTRPYTSGIADSDRGPKLNTHMLLASTLRKYPQVYMTQCFNTGKNSSLPAGCADCWCPSIDSPDSRSEMSISILQNIVVTKTYLKIDYHIRTAGCAATRGAMVPGCSHRTSSPNWHFSTQILYTRCYLKFLCDFPLRRKQLLKSADN
jgi:hypothetical protein